MNLNVDTSREYSLAVEQWAVRPAVNECPEDNFRAGWQACARVVRAAERITATRERKGVRL